MAALSPLRASLTACFTRGSRAAKLEEYTLYQNKSCCEGLGIFAQQLFNSKSMVDFVW
jgi:hypothetical protein